MPDNPYLTYEGKIVLVRKDGEDLEEYVAKYIKEILWILIDIFKKEYPLIKLDRSMYFWGKPETKDSFLNDYEYKSVLHWYDESSAMAFTRSHDIYLFLDRIMNISKVEKSLGLDDDCNMTKRFNDYSLRQVFIYELGRTFYHEAFHIHDKYIEPMSILDKDERVRSVKGYSKRSENYAENNAIKFTDKYFHTILRKVKKLEAKE